MAVLGRLLDAAALEYQVILSLDPELEATGSTVHAVSGMPFDVVLDRLTLHGRTIVAINHQAFLSWVVCA
uniref:MTM0832 n=1 Tax=Volvox carteri f. nagariensis TaxID=3068 RepID=D9CJ82_VOLCA|nr:MTM0832 [Volvox carteri f. nagariensis]